MGQTQLIFAFCILPSFLQRCLEKDQPTGDNESKIQRQEQWNGSWKELRCLMTPSSRLHQLWTAYPHTSYDMRKTKPSLLRLSDRFFLQSAEHYLLVKNRHISASLNASLNKLKVTVRLQVKESLDLGKREYLLQCSIHSGSKSSAEIHQILLSSWSHSWTHFIAFPRCGHVAEFWPVK